jgi:hypothetical protein
MDNVVEVILRVRDQASAALAQVQRAAGDVQRSLGEVQRGLEGLGSSLGAILGTGGLAYALSSAARAAQEAEASMRVLQNTARAAGVDYARLSATLNQVLEPLGVLPEQAAQATAMLLRAGLSTEQIAAAFQAGAASALNAGKTAAEGINNVAMALSTGQSIYLNYIGIAENIGPVLNKVASSMKGASDEAIKQAQNQAALNIILRATAQEVASLPDILTGLTGATNRFNLELYQLKVTIGQQVRPVLTALYQIGADLLGLFRNLDPAVRQSITTWAMATTAATGLATAVGMLLPVIRNAATVVLGLGRTLLWLVTSPIGLVVGAVALLAREWINMSGSAEDARRKLYILGQALWGLAEVAQGVVQAVAGLLSNFGNGLATIARAFLKVIRGDFVGAWEEIKNSWNLESWAARFTAANESFKRGLDLIGSSFRGEVRPEVEKTGKALEDLVTRWQQFFNAAQKQGDGAAPKLPPLPGLDAGPGAGDAGKTQTAADRLRGSLTALRQLYELSRISAEQYAQGLQLIYDRALELERRFPQLASALRDVALDARKGLEDLRRAAEEEGKRISDALLQLAQDIATAKTEAWARAWEANFPPPDKLKERITELQRLFTLGRISEDQFARGLQEIYERAVALERQFPNLAAGYQEVQLAVQSAIRSIAQEGRDLPDWETAASGLKTFLEAIPGVAKGAVETVRSLVGVLGADDLWEVIEANIAFLLDIQSQIPTGTAAYQALDNAIAELRQTYIDLYPAVRAANEEVFISAEDWYNVVAGAEEYREELRKLIGDYERGAISQDRLNQKLAELLDSLQSILPTWEKWVDTQEKAGKVVTAEREALAALNEELATLGIRINSIDREKFRWLFDPLQGIDITPSGLQTFLQGVPDVARETVETMRSLIGVLGADDLREVFEANIAFLLDLQQKVPEGTDAYRALAAAIAELRLEYLRLFSIVQEAHEEIFTPAEDWYDVVAGAKAYRDELVKLVQGYQSGAIAHDEFNKRLAELQNDLQGILPAWGAWVDEQERAGKNMAAAREALAALNEELATLGIRISNIDKEKFQWLFDPLQGVDTTPSALQTFLQGVQDVARGTVETVRSLIGQLGADDLREVLETNIAFLLNLQQRVPESTDAYRALAAAIGELRVEYLKLFPVVREANEEIFTPADNYYDVEAGVKAYREELEGLLSALEKGTISQEEFNEKFAELLGNLQGILPVWKEWLEGVEAAGVNTEAARQALSALNEELAQTQERIRSIEQARLDRWVSDLTNAIQTATDAISGMLDAFNADTFGRGLAQFARGLGDLIGLIPGGRLIGGLVSAVGGLLGRLWDGIASVFDSGWGKVQARLTQISSEFKLVDPAILQRAVETYYERYLFGLINVTKYRVNEEVLKTLTDAAKRAEGAVRSALQAAVTSDEPALAWQRSIYQATIDAVVQGLMESEAVRAALGDFATQFALAVASGDASAIMVAGKELADAFAGLASYLAALQDVLAEWRKAIEEQERVQRIWQDAAQTAERAARNALVAGARAAIEGGDISQAWREALYKSTVDALIAAFLNQGWLTALKPILDQLASAIAGSDETGVAAAMAELAQWIDAIARHMDALGPIGEELRRLLGLVPETVDQAADALQKTLEGVAQTTRNAISAALQAVAGGGDAANAWNQVIYQATLDALVQALMDSEVIRDALDPFREALAEAIRSGNTDAILAAGRNLALVYEQIRPILESLGVSLREFIRKSVPEEPPEWVKSLDQSVAGAIRRALEAAARGEDWQAALQDGVRSAVLSALVDAVVRQGVIQGILAPYLEGIREAILAGQYALVGEYIRGIVSAMPAIERYVRSLFGSLEGVFGQVADAGNRAATAMERVAESVTNLPSWYRLNEVRLSTELSGITVNIYGHVVGVDDLAAELDRAMRRQRYSVTGGWS